MKFKDIKLDEDIILKSKIPLLIEDKDWLKLFANVNNRDIQNLKKQLEELVKNRRTLEKEEKDLQEEKTMAFKMILGVSNAVNNEDRAHNIGLLDKYKRDIEIINNKLEDISYQLETIPRNIRDINFSLLKTTIYYGYRELKIKEKKLQEINKDLSILRERAKILINNKYDFEEEINLIYFFLHGILGSKEIEKLDEQVFE